MNEYHYPSIRNFLSTYYKRKNLILLIMCWLVFLALVWTIFISPNYYKTAAKILIKPNRADVYTPTSINTGRGNGKVFQFNEKRVINAEIEIIKSRVILEQVITTLGLKAIYPDIGKSGIIGRLFPLVDSQLTIDIEPEATLMASHTNPIRSCVRYMNTPGPSNRITVLPNLFAGSRPAPGEVHFFVNSHTRWLTH